MKRCPKCKEEKPFTEFWKNRCIKGGLNTYCKPCAYKLVYGEASTKRRIKYMACVRNSYLKRLYGINQEEYNALLESQKGKCAICEKERDNWKNKALAVDHDKELGKIRGILCENCNRAIGLLKHDIFLLEKAIIYLKKYDELNKESSVKITRTEQERKIGLA